MVLFTHPFGNANVRALLDALQRNGLLARFITTLGCSKQSYPHLSDHIRGKLRRNYALPAEKIDIHPFRESARLVASALNVRRLTAHETGWASIDRVWESIDRETARRLRANKYGADVRAVYAYEDCAEHIFNAASKLGLRRVYDLPIAYWETSQRLLGEEANRYPDWEPTLLATRDSPQKLARKTRELELAELVVCPSRFVFESLPAAVRATKRCIVVPFGSPDIDVETRVDSPNKRLRVLFAGAMTQRKGLADLFAAMKLVDSSKVELVVAGSLLRPLNWYREQFPDLVYESPRPHREFLELMQTCDVFVLPSIVEGRALVQQEAMTCGLPLIATANAGGDDLIVEGETGFLVPIRAPEKLAEKIGWCVENRTALRGMAIATQKKAREFTWTAYGEKVVSAVRALISE